MNVDFHVSESPSTGEVIAWLYPTGVEVWQVNDGPANPAGFFPVPHDEPRNRAGIPLCVSKFVNGIDTRSAFARPDMTWQDAEKAAVDTRTHLARISEHKAKHSTIRSLDRTGRDTTATSAKYEWLRQKREFIRQTVTANPGITIDRLTAALPANFYTNRKVARAVLYQFAYRQSVPGVVAKWEDETGKLIGFWPRAQTSEPTATATAIDSGLHRNANETETRKGDCQSIHADG